jgi:bifunctional DNase/RNase
LLETFWKINSIKKQRTGFMDTSKDFIQVDIFGLSLTSSVSGGGFAIILKEVDGERRLPIIIGQFEAQAIAYELEGKKPPRPLTHDLLKTMLETLGYSVDSVYITELRDSTFYAKIKLDNEIIDEVDSRPSDAIAIALKFSSPIYVAANVLDEIGFVPEPGEEKSDEEKSDDITGTGYHEKEEKGSKIDILKKELDEAIINEDYEKAAMLRDEIKKLSISHFN